MAGGPAPPFPPCMHKHVFLLHRYNLHSFPLFRFFFSFLPPWYFFQSTAVISDNRCLIFYLLFEKLLSHAHTHSICGKIVHLLLQLVGTVDLGPWIWVLGSRICVLGVSLLLLNFLCASPFYISKTLLFGPFWEGLSSLSLTPVSLSWVSGGFACLHLIYQLFIGYVGALQFQFFASEGGISAD